MRAAWDWDLPRETDAEERELVSFAAELGFDTLIVNDPTPAMVERGHERGVRIVAVVSARPDDAFRGAHPDCCQSVRPVEEVVVDAVADAPGEYQQLAHRWFPLVHGGDFLCFEHERSLSFLEERVSEALSTADGVAFDGFGFRNHYACFCAACTERRARKAEATGDHEYEVLCQVGAEQLVEATRRLYEHAGGESGDALVTNHVWPPYAPEPYYGHRLPLDYCTQTISWFYRPAWSTERVAFEAAEHARLAGEANEFVPFVGLFDDPYQRRPPERLARELEIALEHGDGSLVLCTLAAPRASEAHAEVVREALA
jgi:hypothetical protein